MRPSSWPSPGLWRGLCWFSWWWWQHCNVIYQIISSHNWVYQPRSDCWFTHSGYRGTSLVNISRSSVDLTVDEFGKYLKTKILFSSPSIKQRLIIVLRYKILLLKGLRNILTKKLIHWITYVRWSFLLTIDIEPLIL